MSRSRDRGGSVLLGIALCAAVFAVFRPLLQGGFFLDDLIRLYDLANYGLLKLLITPHGGHLLGASNGVYALFWRLFGLEPHRWFAAVLTLHAFNTLLLFGLLRRLGCRMLVAGVMAALWALCPVQAGALSWIAVFGHVLLGTIMLVWLRDVSGVAASGIPVSRARVGLWWVLGVLAATSFGTGLGLAAALPLATLLLLGHGSGRRRAAIVLASLLAVIPALYVAEHLAYRHLYTVEPFMTPVTSFRLDREEVMGQIAEASCCVLAFVVYAGGALLLGGKAGALGNALTGSPLPPEAQLTWLGAPVAALLMLAGWALWQAPAPRRAQLSGLALLMLAGYVTLAVGVVLADRIGTLRSLGLNQAGAIAYKP
jgi:hypothetical protein